MEILLWLVPAGVVTVVAMLWAAWAGRPRRDDRAVQAQRREDDHDRFAKAITRRHPGATRPRPATVRDRSTGIAVRPSRRDVGQPRRSA